MKHFNQLNGLALAYMGDGVYEMYVRKQLIQKGFEKPNNLHRQATKYVSAKAQAMLMKAMLEQESFLSDDEIDIYKRGRNAKSATGAKNTDVVTYRVATGFEALIGYLYLEEKESRLHDVLEWCITYIGEKNDSK